ncbi:MAG: rod shape-determining protein MreC [bacterium]
MKKDTSLKTRFLISLVIYAIIFLFLDKFGFLNGIKSSYDSITSPIQKSFVNVNQQVLSFQETLNNLSSYKEQVEKLETQVNILRETQLKLDLLQKENDILRNQLGLKLPPGKSLIESEIVNFSNYNSPEYIVINVGATNQVVKGDVVVSGKYAVGIVTNVLSNTSEVELITSKNTNLSVENISGSAKGVMTKDNKNRLLMTLILPEEQILEGDQIITSGLNSPFPYGLLIGTVVKVNKSANNFNSEAEINKYLDFVKLQKVFVIK